MRIGPAYVIVCGQKGSGKTTFLSIASERGFLCAEIHDVYLALLQRGTLLPEEVRLSPWVEANQIRLVHKYALQSYGDRTIMLSGLYRVEEVEFLSNIDRGVMDILGIDCSQQTRFERLRARYAQQGKRLLEDVLTQEEAWRNGLVPGHERTSVAQLLGRANTVLDNNGTMIEFEQTVHTYLNDLSKGERVRISMREPQ